jgi:hypothetical protein
MDSAVSYVNIFITFIKYSDIKGTISQEIHQFSHAIICSTGHQVTITKVICFIKQWNVFVMEKRNMLVVGWWLSSMLVPFYVILKLETGPDNNRRLIYVYSSPKAIEDEQSCFSTPVQHTPKLIFTKFQ